MDRKNVRRSGVTIELAAIDASAYIGALSSTS
jgi:hypothetical protein